MVEHASVHAHSNNVWYAVHPIIHNVIYAFLDTMLIKLLPNAALVHLHQDASIAFLTSQQSVLSVLLDFILIPTQHVQHVLCSARLAHQQLFVSPYLPLLDILLSLQTINQFLESVTPDATNVRPSSLAHAQSAFLDFISQLLLVMVTLEYAFHAVLIAIIVLSMPLLNAQLVSPEHTY